MSESSSPMVLDPRVLGQLEDVVRSVGPSFLVRLVDMFVDDTARRLNELSHAWAQGDEQALRAIAHALRGSAAVLGAHEVVAQCDMLEDLPAGLPEAAVGRRVEALSTAYERARQALQILCA